MLDHSQLHKLGIHALDDVKQVPRDGVVSECSGPGGKKGIVLYVKSSAGTTPRDWSFNRVNQQWLERNGYWIGWDKANAPSPADLIRSQTAGGYELTDQHDNKWVLPVVRSPSNRETLPVDYTFTADGELIHKIKKKYEQVWDLAGEAASLLYSVGEVDQQYIDERWPEDWVVRSAIQFLSINYRVGIHEMAAMVEYDRATVDTPFAMKVFYAVTDWEKVTQMEDYIKKKAQIRESFIEGLQSPSLGAAV